MAATFKRIVLPTEAELAAHRAAEEARLRREEEARKSQEAIRLKRIEDERRKAKEDEERRIAQRKALAAQSDKQRQNAPHVDDKVELFCKSDGDAGRRGEQKRWAGWTEGNTLVTEWGRVGAVQQQNRKAFSTTTGARAALRTLVDSKRIKGYR